MTTVISHITALWALRTPRVGRRAARGERCAVELPADPPTLAESREYVQSSEILRDMGLDPHYLASGENASRGGKGYYCHVWTKPLPPNSFVRVSQDLYCVGPELLPVLMAPSLTKLELIVLLSELMGVYAIAPGVQRGLIQRDAPLTTPELLERYLAELGPAHGVGQVKAALKWACVGSASPRETKLSLRLGLKPSMGGYGMTVLSMNEPIEVARIGSRFGEKGIRRPDILIKTCTKKAAPKRPNWLAFEYNGSDHLRPERVAEDIRRSNELKAMGLKEYVIDRELYRNINYMDGIAEQARKDAGYPRRHVSAAQRSEEKAKRIRLFVELEHTNGITWNGKVREAARIDAEAALQF